MTRNIRGANAIKRIVRQWRASERRLRQFKYALQSVIGNHFAEEKHDSELSPLENDTYKQLQQSGYARLRDPAFVRVADYVDATYCSRITADRHIDPFSSPLSKPLFLTESDWPQGREYGNFKFHLSFKDQNLHDFLFNSEIHAALKRYAGRRLLFRESPILEELSYNGSNIVNIDVVSFATEYHTDFYRQIMLMLLLTDIGDETTATEYAQFSNNRNVLKEGNNITSPRSINLMNSGNYPVSRLVGNRGDVLIMDTTGFHRASLRVGTTRKMLIGVLNPGFPFPGYQEDINEFWCAQDTHHLANFLIYR